jgi:parvulin-like peptidyl-prolyl isomerase
MLTAMQKTPRMRIIPLLLLAIATAAPLRAEVIDRILATVGGALILQSDAVAAARLGFVELPASGDRLQWTLDRLIERRLMLIEVDRYGPPEPDRALVDERMRLIDQRIGSGERLDAILRETGLSVDQLRLYVRDDLRIEAYVEQRFGSAFRPSDDDLVTYYRSHEAEFTRDGQLRPFAEVREQARVALVAERQAAAVRDWMAGLRRRTEVNVLYLGR